MIPADNPIRFTLTDNGVPGVRYCSGRTIFDEVLLKGQLVCRYWSANGQIVPEMHLGLDDLAANAAGFPMQSFRLCMDGEELSGGWQWISAGPGDDGTGLRDESGTARVFTIRLRHETSPVEVKVNTRLDGSPIIVRWLDLVNVGDVPRAISSVYPMAGRIWCHGSFDLDEVLGQDTLNPLYLAYDHLQTWWTESDFFYTPVCPGTFRYGSRNGKSGHARPAFWIRNRLNGETFVCEFAWSGNWDMEIQYDKKHQSVQAGFSMGMGPMDGEMLRVLDPGETISTPAVHAGLFHCEDDRITQVLHEHIRTVVMPKAPEERVCEIEANHRGYLCDRENETAIMADQDVASAVGAELYVVDAGWFGRQPNKWFDNVGDWFAGDWLSHGLEPISDYAHQLGMRFGLWVEVEAAGKNSSIRVNHPDWLAKRDGQPVAGGRALDFSKPEVIAWIKTEIIRLIRQYRLDMFRIDHNHNMGHGGNRQYKGYTENLLWRYYENLYRIFDFARSQAPGVVFQNCAGGGGRLDLGMLMHFHNTETSDCMRQPRGLRIFNNMTMVLPPEILLRAFGTEADNLVMAGDIDFQMRVIILCRPIFRGIAPSMDELNPELKERIRHHLMIYRSFIRPIMPTCDVFHHTPMLPIKKGSSLVVLEYAAKDKSRSVVALFRTSPSEEPYRLYPRGLDCAKKYEVYFDNKGVNVEMPGYALVHDGIRISLEYQFSSEVVTFAEIP